jgi:hypothetical protein
MHPRFVKNFDESGSGTGADESPLSVEVKGVVAVHGFFEASRPRRRPDPAREENSQVALVWSGVIRR